MSELATARGEYVELAGVRTWYDDVGTGDPLVLMHGGHVDARFFDQNVGPLAERFRVLLPERRGHGHTPDPGGAFTYELMADETAAFVETVVGGPAHLVGHSDGAVVAMLVALRRPELVRDLVLVSGGFNVSGMVAGPGDDDFDMDQLVSFLGPPYGEVSPDGEDHFRVVAQKTIDMANGEPSLSQEELTGIASRTLVMFGDDDLMSLAHVAEMYAGIPDSELAIVPGTSHFLLQEKPALCNTILVGFVGEAPVPTVAPVRRAQLT
jgi:pimeloyl-ACP methyl ester carboxylesterase